jgi:hypothetical protein
MARCKSTIMQDDLPGGFAPARFAWHGYLDEGHEWRKC